MCTGGLLTPARLSQPGHLHTYIRAFTAGSARATREITRPANNPSGQKAPRRKVASGYAYPSSIMNIKHFVGFVFVVNYTVNKHAYVSLHLA